MPFPSRTVIGRCPYCSQEVVERKKGWFCENKDCRFVLWKDNSFFNSMGKTLTKELACKLLSYGKIHLTGCKSKRTGKTYNATLILGTEEGGRTKFQMEFAKEEIKQEIANHRMLLRYSNEETSYENSKMG